MSKVDALGLKILFLLIPGIIALGIVKSIGPKRPRSDFESSLQIFVYGIVCYAITGFLEGLELWHTWVPVEAPLGKSFWQVVGQSTVTLAALNPDDSLHPPQIGLATLIAIVLGCGVAKLQSHSVIHERLRKLRLTDRINEVDIWGFALNTPALDTWITVRHHDNGRIYQGWVRGYSDGGDERELLLAAVSVYVYSDAVHDLVLVDTIPALYLGLDRKNAVIEFRERPAT
jgi:hypothetical protein